MSVDWLVENLRLTFLGVGDWVQRPIFGEIAGAPPAQSASQQLPVQLHQETGNVSGAYLSVSQQPGRIDIVLTDQPTRNTRDSGAPDYRPLFWVGSLKDSLDIFGPITSKAISLHPRATRLAYSITSIHQTANVREANTYLRQYLPTITFEPDRDTDLIFQINRPIRIDSQHTINRLARWEAVQTTLIPIQLGSPVISMFPAMPAVPAIFAARVYVDVSTDATNTVPLADSETPELVSKLRSYATTIIKKGDER
jgi:hypothetical protein